MNRYKVTIVVAMCVCIWSGVAMGQDQGGGRRGYGRGGPGFSGRGGDPARMTPEERQERYDHMADHMLERFTSDYVLSEKQQEQVSAKLEVLKAEQIKYAEPRVKEFQALREEMFDMYQRRHDGEQIDEKRMDDLHGRMREMWEGSPLMNHEKVTEEVEAMLPPHQVKLGQEQHAQRDRERQERREQWQQRGGADGRGFGRGRDRGGDGSERQRIDPWDRYVETFSDNHQLDAAQRLTAQSIVTELKRQRDAYRDAHQNEYDELRANRDFRARREASDKLEEPIDLMFEQLQSQLNRVPTTAQIKLAIQAREAARPTSQPATSATTQPSSRRGSGNRSSRQRGPAPSTERAE